MATSWVEVPENSHFPIQNLPYGIFSTKSDPLHRPGVAIGSHVLDLQGACQVPALAKTAAANVGAFDEETLNKFMSLEKMAWQEVRAVLVDLLRADNPALRDNTALRKKVLVPMDDVEMHLPACIGDYTDFYLCEEHARNATAIRTGFRMVAPNWKHLPVAYHSRSSSVVVSGTDVRRPWGQTTAPVEGSAIYKWLSGWWSMANPTTVAKPCAALDYELEMGCFVGGGNEMGQPIGVNDAREHIFGLVLLNDWSARDFQRWEMLPLGPFNSKNFATSISPWVVTLEALQPFLQTAPEHAPLVLPYLQENERCLHDINLQATIQPPGKPASTVTTTNFQQLYWTPQQMVAHHTYGGCNLRPGDLLGTGTVSSPGPGGGGCLLEQTWGGSRTIKLEGGDTRKYLEDGDTVTLSGFCQGDGFRVGFGECKGKILPAKQ